MKPERHYLVLGTLLALACGAPPAEWPPVPEGYAVSVVVENNMVNRTDVVVRMVPYGSSPILLGGAAPGEEKALEYRSGNLGGSFTLRASTGRGDEITSRAFTLFPGAIVIWRLRRNELQVMRGSAPHDTASTAPGRPSIP